MKAFIVTLILLCGINSAHALGKVSRACPYDELPSAIRTPLMILAEVIGTAPTGSLIGLNLKPAATQHRYWALESLTIDWVKVRYYLYAENQVYWSSFGDRYWHHFRSMESAAGQWSAQVLPQGVLSDPDLSIFFANRGFFYSARAGHSDIFEFLNDPADFKYRVVGRHYYYDSMSKVLGDLGFTDSTSCSLDQWGIEVR